MDHATVRKFLINAFVTGGQWADQFQVWNQESSSLDLKRALEARAQYYADDLLSSVADPR